MNTAPSLALVVIWLPSRDIGLLPFRAKPFPPRHFLVPLQALNLNDCFCNEDCSAKNKDKFNMKTIMCLDCLDCAMDEVEEAFEAKELNKAKYHELAMDIKERQLHLACGHIKFLKNHIGKITGVEAPDYEFKEDSESECESESESIEPKAATKAPKAKTAPKAAKKTSAKAAKVAEPKPAIKATPKAKAAPKTAPKTKKAEPKTKTPKASARDKSKSKKAFKDIQEAEFDESAKTYKNAIEVLEAYGVSKPAEAAEAVEAPSEEAAEEEDEKVTSN